MKLGSNKPTQPAQALLGVQVDAGPKFKIRRDSDAVKYFRNLDNGTREVIVKISDTQPIHFFRPISPSFLKKTYTSIINLIRHI